VSRCYNSKGKGFWDASGSLLETRDAFKQLVKGATKAGGSCRVDHCRSREGNTCIGMSEERNRDLTLRGQNRHGRGRLVKKSGISQSQRTKEEGVL